MTAYDVLAGAPIARLRRSDTAQKDLSMYQQRSSLWTHNRASIHKGPYPSASTSSKTATLFLQKGVLL